MPSEAELNEELIAKAHHFASTGEGEESILDEWVAKFGTNFSFEVSGHLTGSLMHDAAINGHTHVIEAILKRGADFNLSIYSRTPISYAAEHGHLEIIKTLRGKAEINNSIIWKPIEIAAQEGYVDVLKELIAQGATFTYGDLLRKAIERRQSHVVEAFLEDAIQEGADLHYLLQKAVESDDIASCKILIEKGKINTFPLFNSYISGERQVFSYLALAVEKRHLEIAELLIASGEDVHAIYLYGLGLAHRAIWQRDYAMLELLLKHGAPVSTPDGFTLTHCAVDVCDGEVISVLVEQGVDLNGKQSESENTMGVTAAFVAAQRGFASLLRELHYHKANLHLPATFSITHLRGFAQEHNVEERMNQFIDTCIRHHPEATTVMMTPRDIAWVMNREHAVSFLDSISAPLNIQMYDIVNTIKEDMQQGKKGRYTSSQPNDPKENALEVLVERLKSKPLSEGDLETKIMLALMHATVKIKRNAGNCFWKPHSVSELSLALQKADLQRLVDPDIHCSEQDILSLTSDNIDDFIEATCTKLTTQHSFAY